jgi:hypothetical protein
MLGHTQDVFSAVRQNLEAQIDLSTTNFSETQRAFTNALVGASMADLIWQSSTDPNEEKRYELPKVARDVAKTIVDSAAMAAQQHIQTESDFASFMAGPKVRQIAAETKNEVSNLLARGARGQ